MSQAIKQLLDLVEAEMIRLEYWQVIAPTPDKMLSEAPFSIDTLSFLEWLQWIYIARLRALIEAGSHLPRGAQVLSYAEYALKIDGKSAPRLLDLIGQLDKLLT